ncbi:uncharacterized protein G2W53_028759 [Senna tora]|uniref:Uncharacterized protein n=1 Tax=Senna tora TaxID=362788 RepID=A0A834W933_9FABA|nr:uncharacterized protein G2W53_028759 [Senna tora]
MPKVKHKQGMKARQTGNDKDQRIVPFVAATMTQGIFKSAEYAILLSLQREINTQNDLQHLLIVASRNLRARKKLDVVVRIFSSTIIKPFNASSCSSLLSLLTLHKEGRQGEKEARLLNEMTTSPSSTSSTSWLLSLTLHHQILPHPGCCHSHCTRNGLLPLILAILACTAPGGMCDIVNSFTLIPGTVGGDVIEFFHLVPSSTPSMLVTGTFSSSIIDSFLARRHCVARAIINSFYACHQNL